MTGPVEWLWRHLAEVEKDARAADGVGVHAETFEAAGHYVGAGAPEAVLRLVAGARQILAEHADGGARECTVCAPVDWDAEERPGRYRYPADWPCRTVRLLAEAWGWEEEQHGC